MPYRDFRDYLTCLEKAGLLKWVDAEVEVDWELSCVARAVFRGLPSEKRFAIGFRKIKGFDSPVVVGAIGASKEVQALAMECSPDVPSIHGKWSQAQARPIAPIMVETAPCKEVILKGKDIDLHKFPIPVWTPEKDAGAFLQPVWISKDPETKVRNVGMYRCQIKARDKTGVYYSHGEKHGAFIQGKYDRLNAKHEAAAVIGCDPSVYMGGVTKLPFNVDELGVAGGIRCQPLELVKCETIDMEVPASAEMVIEGEFLPNEVEPEGPFGEWTGYMASAPFGMPIFHVKCITHRRNPIILGVLSQMPPSESSGVRQALSEGTLWKHLTQDLKLPGIVDVHMPESGGAVAWLWISINKLYVGQVQQIASASIGCLGGTWSKWIVIVDDDVDIRDPFAREWALGFRVRPEKDIHFTPVTSALLMDPSAAPDEAFPVGERTGAKVIIDATKKWAYPQIALPPRKYLEEVIKRWPQYGLPEIDSSWVFRGVPED